MFCRKEEPKEEPKREPVQTETRELTMPVYAWKLLDGMAEGHGNTPGQYVYSLMKFYYDTIYESSDIVECRKLHNERLKKMGSKSKED